jgi:hypothetical protein
VEAGWRKGGAEKTTEEREKRRKGKNIRREIKGEKDERD